MARPGPKPKVSDLRLLFEVMVVDDGSIFAGQITPVVDLDTTQGVRDRLNELAADGEYLEKYKVGERNLYRLTGTGREHLLTEVRRSLD